MSSGGGPCSAPGSAPVRGGGRRAPRGVGVLAALALAALGFAWTWGRFALPDPERAAGPTVRLFARGEEIAAFQGISRRSQVWIPLPQIPPQVVNAVLAAEDRRFFQHPGVDVWAVLRAATTDLRQGELRQGGSTITQQLARTLFLTNERTWGRKLREAIIAVALDLRYPKERILEAYLNSVYMGQDGDVAVYGLGAAARHFLGVDLASVRPDEAALLATAIQAPNRVFSGNPAPAKGRRDAVLQVMRREGMPSEAEAQEAMARPLPWAAGPAPLRAPYFVDVARQEVARRIELPASGEVRIATTLDPDLQRAAESAIRGGLARLERGRGGPGPGRIQAALVALEPASGQIRALVGGRGYLGSPFNRATQGARQPGSLFKPIVYLAAFEAEREGRGPRLTPASLIPDAPVAIRAGGGFWSPRNLDRRFRGAVTVRRALEQSLNVPTVRVAQNVGLDRVVAAARALGIRSPLSAVPSLALGTSEVTLLEITGAFAVLADGGIRMALTTLDAGPKAEGARAVSAESAFLITHLLRGVMRDGTARASARWGLRDLTAGKTGSSDGLRDAWFVGYTPDLAVGVWVGRDDDTPLGLTGAQAALPIWAAVMQAAVRRAPPRPFTPPPGIVMASVDRATGRLASFWCGGGDTIEEAFREGSEPPAACGGTPLAGAARTVVDWIQGLFR